uniref:H.polymorpha DL1 DNA for region containing 9 open reading frames n=1 Tax=Pichia angusta TaxID=870730 RepID=Q04293_PICAN|nr:unnamed protein product [Ogataea angusta]
MLCNSFIHDTSYTKIWSTSTTTSRLRFILTYKIAVGNVSSQITALRFVLIIFSLRIVLAGLSPIPTTAIRDVENNISTKFAPPSSAFWKHSPNGSQLYTLYAASKPAARHV